MGVFCFTAGTALLVWNFGTLWWQERHLTTRDLYEGLGDGRKRP